MLPRLSAVALFRLLLLVVIVVLLASSFTLVRLLNVDLTTVQLLPRHNAQSRSSSKKREGATAPTKAQLRCHGLSIGLESSLKTGAFAGLGRARYGLQTVTSVMSLTSTLARCCLESGADHAAPTHPADGAGTSRVSLPSHSIGATAVRCSLSGRLCRLLKPEMLCTEPATSHFATVVET